MVQFVVNELGALTEITLVKGIGYGCDEEAIMIMEKSLSWTIPKADGQPAR